MPSTALRAGRHIRQLFLNAQFQFFRYFLAIDSSQSVTDSYQSDERSASDKLAVVSYLRLRLMRYPYWKQGHREIVEAYLALNDLENAYGAVQTYRVLATASETWRADYYLGVCYLRSRNLSGAAAVFEALHAERPRDPAISEEYAAAYMGLGEYEKAEKILMTIPEKERSGQVVVALQACAARSTSPKN